MIPSRARVWIAMGHTDMRRGMQGRAWRLQVQEGRKRDPNGGDLFVFSGRSGSLVKILWHDGVGLSLYAKRLKRGRFVWPSAKDGVVALTHTDGAHPVCNYPPLRWGFFAVWAEIALVLFLFLKGKLF